MSRTLLAVALFSLVSAVSSADPFINEPLDKWPVQWQLPTGGYIDNPWVTPFPYQRNIRYTFDNENNARQVIYSGYDDPVLHPSDGLEGTSNWLWYADDASFQTDGVARRFGLIGIDNRQGTGPVEGWIVFRIDNWDWPNEWKHVWKEIVFLATPGVVEEENITVPDNFETLGPRIVVTEDLGHNWTVLDVAFKVWPNPPYEDLYITVWVPAGDFMLVDEIHFATECVPEPVTAVMVAVGGVGLAVLRRRRRR